MFQAGFPPIIRSSKSYTIFFITVSALNVSGGFSAHHQELKKPYTIFFITVSALNVSGGFSAQRQELKNCIHSIR